MQILGFGGERLTAEPQVFQALSLDGAPAIAPAAAFGTANPNLVPVQTPSSNAPLNLTLKAQFTASAIASIQTGAPLPSVRKAPVDQSPPNSTAFVGAAVPNESQVQVNAAPGAQLQSPAAAVTFTVTAPAGGQNEATQAAPQAPAQPQAAAPPYTLANSSAAGSGAAAKPVSAAQASAQSAQSAAPPAPTAAASVPPAASPSLVQQLASTVQSLLIGKVYAQPVFSFLA